MDGSPSPQCIPYAHHLLPIAIDRAALRRRLRVKLADAAACRRAALVAEANGNQAVAGRRHAWADDHLRQARCLRQRLWHPAGITS